MRYSHLFAAITPRHKLPTAILTPAIPRLRIPNTPSPHTSIHAMLRIPEKSPAIRLISHLRRRFRRRAGVRRAAAVGSAVAAVVLVVCLEDCKSLLGGCAGVVGAFGGLDCG